MYVGFWESGDYINSNSIGVCEEWWFAENIGPVYIASYSASREVTCIQNLAASNLILTPSPSCAIDYPDLYLPAANNRAVVQMSGYKIRPALGYLKLDDRCIQSPSNVATHTSCWVDYY